MILNKPGRSIPQIDRLNFLADHYEELKLMYETIMEHLKVPVGNIELPDNSVTGESLWEADKTRTFIPYFVTFNDLPKSVCDLAYATFDEYGKGHEIPLYWVSDTTYAIPIPCTTYVYDNEEWGDTGTLDDIYIVIPYHTEVRDNKNYFFTKSYLRIYWNEGMHGLGNLNHAYIGLYDTYIDITTRQVSEGIWNDELEDYEYPEVLDTYTQSYTLTVNEVIFTETTVTFNSIKPKNNNKTILEVV